MQKNTVVVVNNNITPVSSICFVKIDTTVEPQEETNTEINYDTLTAPEKSQYDACMTMLESKIPA